MNLTTFIQSEEVCFNVGYPTALGFIILVILIIIAGIGWGMSRN